MQEIRSQLRRSIGAWVWFGRGENLRRQILAIRFQQAQFRRVRQTGRRVLSILEQPVEAPSQLVALMPIPVPVEGVVERITHTHVRELRSARIEEESLVKKSHANRQ